MKPICSKFLTLAGAAALFGSSAQADIIEVNTNITSDARWTRDNVYVLTKIVYVIPPAKLTVEPGTIIRGADESAPQAFDPGTLVIARGAKLIGNATVDDPIIYTSIDDPYVPGAAKTIPTTVRGAAVSVVRNYSPDGPEFDNAFAYTKLSGGLVLLGRSPIGYDGDGDASVMQWASGFNEVVGDETLFEPTGASSVSGLTGGNGTGFAVIEGLALTQITIPTAFDPDGSTGIPGADNFLDPDGPTGPLPAVANAGASTTFRPGVYGGVDLNDSTGVIRFWSHRYGGFNINANNEINGVTMGGLGRGTVMEWQEVCQNADDGFEWFGGFNDGKYLFSVLNGDDAFDADQGFQGRLQHLFGINDNENYIRSGYANGAIGRSTTVSASDKLFEWDGSEPNNAGVTPNTNSTIVNWTVIGSGANGQSGDHGINIKVFADGLWTRGIMEDIKATTILVANSSPGDVTDSLFFNAVASTTVGAGNNVATFTAASGSQLRARGHATKNGLDPRMTADSDINSISRDVSAAAYAPLENPPVFFTPVSFRGAMRDNNWLFGWSWTHAVDLMPTTNVDRPAVTLSTATVSSVQRVLVSFAADTDETAGSDKVVYVVERSTNGKIWTPVVAIQDGATGDLNATAGQIQVRDNAYTYNGSIVHYRVIPQ